MRTFSQSESTRLLSSLQVYKVLSLSQQHGHRKPQDSGPHQPVPTRTHVQSRAMSHVAQYRPTHITPG